MNYMELEDRFGSKLEMMDSYESWNGFDCNASHALEYGFVWTTDHPGTDDIMVYMRAGEDKWDSMWFCSDPHELIAYYDWIKWDEVAEGFDLGDKTELHLSLILNTLMHENVEDVMGVAYSGYLTTEQVISQIIKHGGKNV